ncbi:MAG: radical SAM protein [Candidatus Tectomicrobia bacterium]|uniref:Radical SAM protein n=1 Tax=Tectimicrobiota bacterium TaxID=2528274 RepID=A0A932CS17_UNCTE|nr:radical SAM protein [Candidatus Tectomicrobia bacterium]
MTQTHTEPETGCPTAPDGEPLTRTTAWFYKFTAPSRRRARDEKRILMVDVELTDKCFGGCVYCFASGRKESNFFIPRERMFGLIDEAKEIGLRQVLLIGGEPLLHPDWYDFSRYTLDQGMRSVICSTGDHYTPKIAKTIVHDLKIQENGYCTIHIPTINQQAYEQICPGNPQGLKTRIRGLYTLLEAGYPPEKVYCQLVLCQPILESLEETVDWLVVVFGFSLVVL